MKSWIWEVSTKCKTVPRWRWSHPVWPLIQPPACPLEGLGTPPCLDPPAQKTLASWQVTTRLKSKVDFTCHPLLTEPMRDYGTPFKVNKPQTQTLTGQVTWLNFLLFASLNWTLVRPFNSIVTIKDCCKKCGFLGQTHNQILRKLFQHSFQGPMLLWLCRYISVVLKAM